MDKEPKKVNKYEFYFETSLYEDVIPDGSEENLFQGIVNAYNSMDGFDTTYTIQKREVSNYGWNGFSKITLDCKRGGKTELKFFVIEFANGTLMKVGQFPSLANIQFAEIGKRYNSFLSKEDLKNYKKAIGLYAHGAGAGSFVYLRRIFENLIFETYENNKGHLNLEEKDFKIKRMEEKIEILKSFLPSQLLEMKNIYKILSKGVHELEEEECLNYFSPIKLSITLILDQKIEEAVKKYKDRQVKQELQDIHQKLSKKTEDKQNDGEDTNNE